MPPLMPLMPFSISYYAIADSRHLLMIDCFLQFVSASLLRFSPPPLRYFRHHIRYDIFTPVCHFRHTFRFAMPDCCQPFRQPFSMPFSLR